MIKHTVCFKLGDNSAESMEKASEILLSMKGKVPQIISMEVGTDILHSPRSYDVILQVKVKDEAALQAYQNDKYHCEIVKEYMHAVSLTSIAVDTLVKR